MTTPFIMFMLSILFSPMFLSVFTISNWSDVNANFCCRSSENRMFFNFYSQKQILSFCSYLLLLVTWKLLVLFWLIWIRGVHDLYSGIIVSGYHIQHQKTLILENLWELQ